MTATRRPSRRLERSLQRQGLARIAGVDEVGVACLAGPVVAAAVIMPAGASFIAGVRDSKQVPTREERERLAREIRAVALAVGVGRASVLEIDRLNILHATHLAMRRALALVLPYDHALVDGNPIRDVEMGSHTEIVRGDARVYSIACASIVAKVARDRLMVRLAASHPGYGWARNVGYPTPEHRAALRRLGVTRHHRRDFGTVRLLRLGEQLGLPGLSPD